MKVAPTLEGGLRLDLEDADDWDILRRIGVDARARATDLADAMGALIDEEAGGGDWREYVVPDLREAFADEIDEIGAVIESAAHQAGDGVGPVWITPASAYPWYSAFNQARLALEELYHFGSGENPDPAILGEEAHEAYLRSKFYFAIQSLLLEYVLK